MRLNHTLHADEADTSNRESAPYALNALIKKTESYVPPPEPRPDDRSAELLDLEPDLDSLPMRAVLENRASRRPRAPRSMLTGFALGLLLTLLGGVALGLGTKQIATRPQIERVIIESAPAPTVSRELPLPSMVEMVPAANAEPAESLQVEELVLAFPERVVEVEAPMTTTPTPELESRDTMAPPPANPIPDAEDLIDGAIRSDAPATEQVVDLNDLFEQRPVTERDDSSLPRSLSKAQVVTGMRSVARQVRNCAPDGVERVSVDLSINGATGEVTRARTTGSIGGTPEGACIERALRRAHFPRFSDDTLNVNSYPFVIGL